MAEIVYPPEAVSAYNNSPEMLAQREAFLARMRDAVPFLKAIAEDEPTLPAPHPRKA
jgi:hypothetical protein